MHNISLRKIKIVVASAREKSFTQASIKENISQPAITNTIRDVEETIGTDIFIRTGNVRRAELSQKGEHIVRAFEDIVSNYEQKMRSIIANPSLQVAKRQKIVIQQELVEFMRPDYLDVVKDAVQHKSSTTVICNKLSGIEQDVSQRNILLAIVESMRSVENADYIHLGTLNVPLCAVRAREHEKSNEISVQTIWQSEPQDLIFFSNVNNEVRRFIRGRLQRNLKTIDEFFQIDSEKMFTNLILSEKMIGVLPLSIASRIFPPNSVELLPLDEADIQVPYGALLPWGTTHEVNVRVLRENPIQHLI